MISKFRSNNIRIFSAKKGGNNVEGNKAVKDPPLRPCIINANHVKHQNPVPLNENRPSNMVPDGLEREDLQPEIKNIKSESINIESSNDNVFIYLKL